jgi:hypothetical protein
MILLDTSILSKIIVQESKAQLCQVTDKAALWTPEIEQQATLFTTDLDFSYMATHCPLRLFQVK